MSLTWFQYLARLFSVMTILTVTFGNGRTRLANRPHIVQVRKKRTRDNCKQWTSAGRRKDSSSRSDCGQHDYIRPCCYCQSLCSRYWSRRICSQYCGCWVCLIWSLACQFRLKERKLRIYFQQPARCNVEVVQLIQYVQRWIIFRAEHASKFFETTYPSYLEFLRLNSAPLCTLACSMTLHA